MGRRLGLQYNARLKGQPREGQKGCTSHNDGVYIEWVVSNSCRHII